MLCIFVQSRASGLHIFKKQMPKNEHVIFLTDPGSALAAARHFTGKPLLLVTGEHHDEGLRGTELAKEVRRGSPDALTVLYTSDEMALSAALMPSSPFDGKISKHEEAHDVLLLQLLHTARESDDPQALRAKFPAVFKRR